MDAIYKTTKYGFPCFFLVVKTSLGIGRVAATIIPQYETTEMIKEGLQILKSWNLQWKPKFFMTDKSSQELEAVAAVHRTCIRYIFDFHREEEHFQAILGEIKVQPWYTNDPKLQKYIQNEWLD